MSHSTKIMTVPIRDISALHSAVSELQAKGVRCRLLTNATPRMYYENQLQKHGITQDGKADFVLRLEDSPYDVALVKNKDGIYDPVFDNWTGFGGNSKGIKHVIGVPFTEQDRHDAREAAKAIPGATSDMIEDAVKAAEMAASLGQFLQPYSKHATINAATAAGYMVESAYTDDQGRVQLTLATSF